MRIDFDYPEAGVEAEIVMHETKVDKATADKLVQIAHRARNLKGHGLDEGISTRLLAYAGQSDRARHRARVPPAR